MDYTAAADLNNDTALTFTADERSSCASTELQRMWRPRDHDGMQWPTPNNHHNSAIGCHRACQR